jgi:epoxyqueuosine reductase QueG
MKHLIYECGICGSWHPWDWDGDCREDANRYANYEDYAERNTISEDDVEERTWEERCEADFV